MFGFDIPAWVVVAILLAIVVALGTWFLSSTGKKAADAATRLMLDRLVKAECLEKNSGSFDIDTAQIPDISSLDVVTHGFSVESVTGKVNWRKTSRGCTYTVEITASGGGQSASHETAARTVRNCPG